MRRFVIASFVLIAVLVILFSSGCGAAEFIEDVKIAKTRRAEEHPWAVYPISEESKQKLCEALELAADDWFCRPGSEVDHNNVYRKIREVFPVGKTLYPDVEAKLGSFPHLLEENTNDDGELIGLWYIYRLSEYQGACIYFRIDLEDRLTVDEIFASNLGSSGTAPPVCGP